MNLFLKGIRSKEGKSMIRQNSLPLSPLQNPKFWRSRQVLPSQFRRPHYLSKISSHSICHRCPPSLSQQRPISGSTPILLRHWSTMKYFHRGSLHPNFSASLKNPLAKPDLTEQSQLWIQDSMKDEIASHCGSLLTGGRWHGAKSYYQFGRPACLGWIGRNQKERHHWN